MSNIRQEILEAIQALGPMITSATQFYFNSDGTDQYTNVALVNKTMLNVYVDGLLLNTADWSFDSPTGTITFSGALTLGVQVLVQYK